MDVHGNVLRRDVRRRRHRQLPGATVDGSSRGRGQPSGSGWHHPRTPPRRDYGRRLPGAKRQPSFANGDHALCEHRRSHGEAREQRGGRCAGRQVEGELAFERASGVGPEIRRNRDRGAWTGGVDDRVTSRWGHASRAQARLVGARVDSVRQPEPDMGAASQTVLLQVHRVEIRAGGRDIATAARVQLGLLARPRPVGVWVGRVGPATLPRADPGVPDTKRAASRDEARHKVHPEGGSAGCQIALQTAG
mmetsp:Transcript_42582/g.101343  ORF Transcript_42582/g.101343 Transcript_42582/m.101343 type:complete len:249 (+) Transcript_42582:261-1007(+)